jgi:hypothetical protein
VNCPLEAGAQAAVRRTGKSVTSGKLDALFESTSMLFAARSDPQSGLSAGSSCLRNLRSRLRCA